MIPKGVCSVDLATGNKKTASPLLTLPSKPAASSPSNNLNNKLIAKAVSKFQPQNLNEKAPDVKAKDGPTMDKGISFDATAQKAKISPSKAVLKELPKNLQGPSKNQPAIFGAVCSPVRLPGPPIMTKVQSISYPSGPMQKIWSKEDKAKLTKDATKHFDYLVPTTQGKLAPPGEKSTCPYQKMLAPRQKVATNLCAKTELRSWKQTLTTVKTTHKKIKYPVCQESSDSKSTEDDGTVSPQSKTKMSISKSVQPKKSRARKDINTSVTKDSFISQPAGQFCTCATICCVVWTFLIIALLLAAVTATAVFYSEIVKFLTGRNASSSMGAVSRSEPYFLSSTHLPAKLTDSTSTTITNTTFATFTTIPDNTSLSNSTFTASSSGTASSSTF